ncbi:ubiquitin conjugation factor E4, partial [Baffinella frigidus]
PLPPPSALFKSLPEFCIENVVDTLTLVAQNIPSVLETLPVTTLHDFLNFVMAFSSSKAHVKNPYLRGKLLQVACFMIPGDRRQGFEFGGGNLSGLFQEHEVSRHHLVPSLINFYIDVEVTGGHNQFYDKFIYRNHMAKILLYVCQGHNHFYDKLIYRNYMAKILLCVCQFPAYLESVEKFSKDPNTRDTFIRFVTMMLNDANYCFQEAMLKLTEIRKAQHEMALPEYAARPVEERTALEETLSQDGNHGRTTLEQTLAQDGHHTKWGLQQLKDVLNMMQMLTGPNPTP